MKTKSVNKALGTHSGDVMGGSCGPRGRLQAFLFLEKGRNLIQINSKGRDRDHLTIFNVNGSAGQEERISTCAQLTSRIDEAKDIACVPGYFVAPVFGVIGRCTATPAPHGVQLFLSHANVRIKLLTFGAQGT